MSRLGMNLGLRRFNQIRTLVNQVKTSYLVTDYEQDNLLLFDSNFNYSGIAVAGLKAILNSGSSGQVTWGSEVHARDIAVDSNGKYYIIDVAYAKRLYRLNSDFTVDDTFTGTSNYFIDIGGEPDAVEVMADGTIYISNSLHTVKKYNALGIYVQTYDLSAQITNDIIGGIANYNGKLYVTDKNRVFEYTENWIYTGNSWDIRYDSNTKGNNAYAIEKVNGGWLISDIDWDVLNYYDEDFNFISSTPSTVNVATGICKL